MKNFVRLVALFSLMMTSSFPLQSKESKEYRAGKISAYADYCGMTNITQSLFEFFGRTIDYKQAYSENYIWTNNNTPSLSSKCDEELSEAAKKLLEIQPTGNKPTRDAIHESNFSNSKICKLALAPTDNIWDYSTFASKEAIGEARERGLTIRSCAELLGRAKRLNNDTQNKPGNTIVSSESDVDICKIALSKTITAWNPTIYAKTSVKEAQKRSLLPSDCARILATDQQKTADRPSIVNGTTLQKGTQPKQLDLAKKLAHLERLLVQHKNDKKKLKQELNRLKATERQNLLSIERLKKKQDELIADLNLIIRINHHEIEKLARIDKQKFDSLKPLLEKEHSRKKEEAERKAEERRKAAEAERKAEERRKATEAERKAEERRKAAEAERKAEERRKAAEAERKADEKTQNQKTLKNLDKKIREGNARLKQLTGAKTNNYLNRNPILFKELGGLYNSIISDRQEYELLTAYSKVDSFFSKSHEKAYKDLFKAWNDFNNEFPNIEKNIRSTILKDATNTKRKKFDKVIARSLKTKEEALKSKDKDFRLSFANSLALRLHSKAHCLKAKSGCIKGYHNTTLSETQEKLLIEMAFLNSYKKQLDARYYELHELQNTSFYNQKLSVRLPASWSLVPRKGKASIDSFYSSNGKGYEGIIISARASSPLQIRALQTSDAEFREILRRQAIENGCIPVKGTFELQFHKNNKNWIRLSDVQFCTSNKKKAILEFLKMKRIAFFNQQKIHVECLTPLQITAPDGKEQFKYARIGNFDFFDLCFDVSKRLFETLQDISTQNALKVDARPKTKKQKTADAGRQKRIVDKRPQESERHWLFDRWFTTVSKSVFDEQKERYFKGKAWCDIDTPTLTVSRTKGIRNWLNKTYLKEQFADARITVSETTNSVKIIEIWKSGILGTDIQRTSEYYRNQKNDSVSYKVKEQFRDGSFFGKPKAKSEKIYRCLNLDKISSEN